ncbi:MAG: hypothetical protein JNK00_11065 [Flavipsychrobacter sp.]|nr:hypothetical protein [Flavipsychrobacter sp.]
MIQYENEIQRLYDSVINNDKFNSSTIVEIIALCEETLNNKINTVDEFSKELMHSYKFGKRLKYLYSINNYLDWNLQANNITCSNISNNEYPYITNLRFKLHDIPNWAKSSITNFLLYYKYIITVCYRDNIFSTIDLLNKKEYLLCEIQNISKSKTELLCYSIYNAYNNANAYYLRAKQGLITNQRLLFLAIILLGTLISSIANISIIKIAYSDTKAISIGVFSTTATLLGFSVLFLNAAYENIKKNFGTYANSIFFKNTIVIELLFISGITIVISLLSSILPGNKILSPYHSDITDIFFNSSIILFIYLLVTIYPSSKIIMSQSSSITYLEPLINKIDYDTIYNQHKGIPENATLNQINDFYINNELFIIKDIINHSINQGNFKNPNLILYALANKTIQLIYGNHETISKYHITINKAYINETYIDIAQTILKASFKNNRDHIIENIINQTNEISYTLLRSNCNYEVIEQLTDHLVFMTNICIDNKQDESIQKCFWSYYSFVNNLLQYNTPIELEISLFNNYSDHSFQIERKWDVINSVTRSSFIPLAERLLNYQTPSLRNLGIRMLMNISSIIDTANIGEGQKYMLNSMIYYSCYDLYVAYINSLSGYEKAYLPIESYNIRTLIQNEKRTALAGYVFFEKSILLLVESEKLYPHQINDYYSIIEVLLLKMTSEYYEHLLIRALDSIIIIVKKSTSQNRPQNEEINSYLQTLIDQIINAYNMNTHKNILILSKITELSYLIVNQRLLPHSP